MMQMLNDNFATKQIKINLSFRRPWIVIKLQVPQFSFHIKSPMNPHFSHKLSDLKTLISLINSQTSQPKNQDYNPKRWV